MCVNGLSTAVLDSAVGETRTRDLSVTRPTLCN